MPETTLLATETNPIRIRVGYPWSPPNGSRRVPARSDKRWQCIRGWVKSAADTVGASIGKRKPASTSFQVDISRLRGTHGRLLLGDLMRRIRTADIILLDLGARGSLSFNQNVLLEAGMALAFAAETSKCVFILKPKLLDLPSDLQGYLVTDYRQNAGSESLLLEDPNGFHAALRSAVSQAAASRGMVCARGRAFLRDESDV